MGSLSLSEMREKGEDGASRRREKECAKIKGGANGEVSLLVMVVEREKSCDWTSTHEER
jgi:hypothetical protein